MVCLSVACHTRAPCLNRLTELDAIWQVHLWGLVAHFVDPQGKQRCNGSNPKPKHAIANCSQTISLCCHLANTDEELGRLATAIPPFAKLLCCYYELPALFDCQSMLTVVLCCCAGVGVHWVSGSDNPCLGRTEDCTMCACDPCSWWTSHGTQPACYWRLSAQLLFRCCQYTCVVIGPSWCCALRALSISVSHLGSKLEKNKHWELKIGGNIP